MNNVLLVDDEKYAVKGMAAGVDWSSIGVSQVFEAYDVGQAQEIVQQHQVDIAVLDIEMPGKSGLDLAAWLREHSPHTEMIFLTGHANFTYAQQALQMGAYRYLLKPVNYDDLTEILVQAAAKIEQDREMMDYRTIYKKYYTLWESQKPLLVERFWQDAVQERMAFHERRLEPALRQYEIPLLPDGKVLPVLISIEKWELEFGARDEEIMEYAVRKAAEELVLENEPGAVVAERSGSGLILFYLGPGEGGEQRLMEILRSRCEAFIASCNEYFHCRLSCYIGTASAISGLSAAYQYLLAAERKNVTRTNCVLLPSEGEEQQDQLLPPTFSDWAPLFEQGSSRELEERAERYFRRLEEQRVSQETLQAYYYGFAHLCIEAARKKGIAHPGITDIWESVAGTTPVKSVAALRSWTMRLIALHWTEAGAASGGQLSSVTTKIMDYVKLHPEEELSREQLAATVFLNPAYLSRLFRKETGQSLTEYILEVKIGHAKQLLEHSNLKVGSVAEAIGYTHFSYFAKLFKKMTGLTPYEYRKKYHRIP